MTYSCLPYCLWTSTSMGHEFGIVTPNGFFFWTIGNRFLTIAVNESSIFGSNYFCEEGVRAQTLLADPPYMIFQKDKVSSRSLPKFVPKVVSAFHLNQIVHLPIFFPKPHSNKAEEKLHILGDWRALSFYLDCTIRSSPGLFVAYDERATCYSPTHITLDFWLYRVLLWSSKGLLLLLLHSTRAHSASSAFWSNIPIVCIYKAAIWLSNQTQFLKLMQTSAGWYCSLLFK